MLSDTSRPNKRDVTIACLLEHDNHQYWFATRVLQPQPAEDGAGDPLLVHAVLLLLPTTLVVVLG